MSTLFPVASAPKQVAPVERFLRLREVISRTGRTRSSLYEDIKRGKFPANVAIGRRAVAWTESSISEWIAAHVAASAGGRS